MLVASGFVQQQSRWTRDVLIHTGPTRKSFFCKGISSCQSTFLLGIESKIKDGRSTLLWLNRWLEGKTARDMWPNFFAHCQKPFFTVCDFLQLEPNSFSSELKEICVHLQPLLPEGRDSRIWSWDKNINFFVKTFYRFLNKGTNHCGKGSARSNLNLFFGSLHIIRFWKQRINLAKRGCNIISRTTCVLCHATSEIMDHLLLNCPFASRIWTQYYTLFNAPLTVNTLNEV